MNRRDVLAALPVAFSAARPWRPLDRPLPPALAALGYDAYRDVRFRP